MGMAIGYRVRTVTTGLAGGPYLTTHTFSAGVVSDPVDAANAVQAFWFDIRNDIATTATMRVNNEIEIFNPANGQVTNTVSFSPTAIGGNNLGSPEWTAKQGLMALRSATFKNGKRVQGHIYVPGVTATCGEQVPNDTYTTIVKAAGDNLLGMGTDNGAPWCVWSRPSSEGANDGLLAPIATVIPRAKWAVLRSRRD